MSVNSNSAGRISLATSLAGDFTLAVWARFGVTSGLPVLLAFDGAHYTYIDGGDLYLQSANAGAWNTGHHWLVWRRIGGTMSLYGCQQGAAALTLLAEDEFFGTATVSQIDLLGDAIFGASENITISHLLIWGDQQSDSVLLKERWNWHPQETADLEHFVRMSTPSTAGTAEVGANPTVTGTLASAAPKWLVVGDSIASGRLDISDPIDPDSLAGSTGAGSIAELSSLGFAIDGTQAIPGEPMADHVAAMASRLIPALVAAGPGSFVPIFGSINDVFRGDSADCYDAIVSLATAVRNHGCYSIGIGPTDSSWDSPPTFVSADIRAMVMADTANFVDRWDVGADGGHYSLTGGDGLHPVSYSGLNTFFKARLTPYLLGAGAETIDPSGIASSEAFGEASVSLETVAVAPSAVPSGETFGSASIGMQVVASEIASSEAFGGPTLSPGVVSLGPSGIVSSESFGDPAVDPGAAGVSPLSIASTEALGSPVVSAGDSIVAPQGIASAEAFGATTVSPGPVSVSPSSVESDEAFGEASVVVGALTVSPENIPSEEVFGAASLSVGPMSIGPTSIASEESFGDARVDQYVSANGIGSDEMFGEPILSVGEATIGPLEIPSAEAFGSAGVQPGTVSISPSAITTGESFGTPVLSAGSSIVQPAGIAPSAAFGAPSLGVGPVTLSPSSIASQEAFGSARLGQVVGAQSIASDEMLGTPALSMGAVSIGPLGILSAESLGLPRVALELQFLSPPSIASGEAFGLPLISSFEIDQITPIVSGPHVPGGLRVSHRTTQ